MPNEYELMVRLVLAGIFGAAIGLERRAHLKDAGLRTHFAVAVGGALFMIVSKYAFGDVEHSLDVSIDPSRIAAQVASGIGFLGAGTIMVQRSTVKGLTTAAGLWTTAGIGLAAGAGLYVIAACGTALMIGGLLVLQSLERNLVGKIDQISIVGHSYPEMMDRVLLALQEIGVVVERTELETVDKQSARVALFLKFDRKAVTKAKIAQVLTAIPMVERVNFGGQG